MNCTGNTIYLAESTDTEKTYTDTKECKNLCKPFPFFSHTLFNIIERTAKAVTVFCNHTVFDCQKTFGIFGCHSEEMLQQSSRIMLRDHLHRQPLQHRRYYRYRLLHSVLYIELRKLEISPSPSSSFLNIHFSARGSLLHLKKSKSDS